MNNDIRKARGGIRELIERNFREQEPTFGVVWECQTPNASDGEMRSPQIRMREKQIWITAWNSCGLRIF